MKMMMLSLAAIAMLAAASEARADLFVSSSLTNEVLRFDGVTGASEGVFAQGGGLDGPCYLAFSPAAVPEPGSLVLIGGVAGLLAFQRRRAPR